MSATGEGEAEPGTWFMEWGSPKVYAAPTIGDPGVTERIDGDVLNSAEKSNTSEPGALNLGMLVATHRHKKRGTEYVLIGIGRVQAESWIDTTRGDYAESVDMREVAIYRSVDDGTLWVRPREEFEDGRFEPLEAAGEREHG